MFAPRPGSLVATTAAAVVVPMWLAAQQPATPPKFSAETRLVLVQCFVADKDGRAVHGLTRDDFEVKEEGKPQAIVSFTTFDAASAAAFKPPAGDTPSAGPVTMSPEFATVLLVDDGSLSQEQVVRTRPALKTFVERLTAFGGTLSLVAPSSRVSVAARLPTGAAMFPEAIDRISGHRAEDRSSFPVSDAEAMAAERGDSSAMARITSRFAALNPDLSQSAAAMFAHNRAVEVAHDARKRRDAFYGIAALALDWLAKQPGGHRLVVTSPGYPRETSDLRFNDIVTRSMRVNAPIDFIDVRGLRGAGLDSVRYGPAFGRAAGETSFAFQEAAEGSSTLAEQTGGMALGNANELEAILPRLLETMGTYYVLAYEPPGGKPGFRRIEVEMKGAGLQVRARKGYYADAAAR